MKQAFTLNLVAYKKIVFHCLRYPSSKVFGAVTRKANTNEITNAYPLFHTALVAPTLSIALDLVESNLQANEQIAGFYEYSEDDTCILTRIIQFNQQLKNMVIFRISCKNKEFILTCNFGQIQAPKLNAIEQDLVEGKHRLIVDMDAHLDAIELDFTNVYVS